MISTMLSLKLVYLDFYILFKGLNGIMDPVETGLGCGSDTAHMNIFGYNPFKHYRFENNKIII